MSVERLIVAGTEPIEIWDLLTDDGDILWNRQHEPLVVADAIAQLREGRAISRSDGPITAAAGVDRVFFTGGRLLDTELAGPLLERVRHSGMRVRCADDPVFGAAAATSERWPDALVIDVGQTQVKVVGPGRRATRARDLAVLPIRDDVTTSTLTAHEQRTQRAAFVDMVAAAVEAATEPNHEPWRHVILAMPCSLGVDANGAVELGGSSYLAMAGDHECLEQLVAFVPGADWQVLNDAELAVFAACAATDEAPAGGRRELVVTFGFGLGGCVWDPALEAAT